MRGGGGGGGGGGGDKSAITDIFMHGHLHNFSLQACGSA